MACRLSTRGRPAVPRARHSPEQVKRGGDAAEAVAGRIPSPSSAPAPSIPGSAPPLLPQSPSLPRSPRRPCLPPSLPSSPHRPSAASIRRHGGGAMASSGAGAVGGGLLGEGGTGPPRTRADLACAAVAEGVGGGCARPLELDAMAPPDLASSTAPRGAPPPSPASAPQPSSRRPAGPPRGRPRRSSYARPPWPLPCGCL